MSIAAMTWVLQHSTARYGARLVLIALADYAHEDGSNAYPSQATIARSARLTDRQVRSCLVKLADEGHIVSTGTSPTGTAVYQIIMQQTSAPEESSAPEVCDTVPRKSATEMMSQTSYNPLVNPSDNPPSRADAREAGEQVSLELPVPIRRPHLVNKRTVSAEEWAATEEIVACFNEHVGTDFTTSEANVSRMIVRTLRDWPQITVPEHKAMIERNAADPWWDGTPDGVGVLYSPRMFPKALRKKGPPKKESPAEWAKRFNESAKNRGIRDPAD